MNSLNTREDLLKRIRNKRRSIRSYLNHLEPTGMRLANFNIICGAIATVLTAAPAIGGSALIDVIGSSDPSSQTWRMLFAAAALFSLVSTIAAEMYKSREIASRLGKAQACDAKLEGLETLLALDQIEFKNSATQYTQYISEIPFISDQTSNLLRRQSAVDMVKGEILEPLPSQAVEDTFSCSIWVENREAGCHLWLAVEIDGRIWPKERELHIEEDGTWKGTICEEGSVEAFSLSLYAASDKANQLIRAWLDRGDAEGKYEELRRLPGTRRIARVDKLQRKTVH
jgi:hypothetical protein